VIEVLVTHIVTARPLTTMLVLATAILPGYLTRLLRPSR
jgi:hypothetical protein